MLRSKSRTPPGKGEELKAMITKSEKDMLRELFEKKSQVAYTGTYRGSAVTTDHPELGTVEADAAGKYGRWASEDFRASKLAELTVTKPGVTSILDIGGANLYAANYFAARDKTVDVVDFSTSPYMDEVQLMHSSINRFIEGDFNKLDFDQKYSVVWCSHVLEHIPNVNEFLLKIVSLVSDKGYIAIAVPPRKPFIVSGHINLFNPGLLIYRLVLAGLNCAKAAVFQYDGNICVLVQKECITLPFLKFDIGDLELLKDYFPIDIFEGFNGDFICSNLSDIDFEIIYGGMNALDG